MKPTDFMLLLAFTVHRQEWTCADEIAGVLRVLGFDPTAQQVAGWLRRLGQRGAVPVESRPTGWGCHEYRLTRAGRAQIVDRFPGVRP